MKFNMSNPQAKKYIKSFSNGQITVPKEFREYLGLGDVFWLKLSIEQNKIVAEPVVDEYKTTNYSKNLLKIKGNWLIKDEWKQNRKQVERRLNKNA